MAGIIPGLLTAVAYSVSIVFRASNNPKLCPKISDNKNIKNDETNFITGLKMFFLNIWPIILIAGIVLGGIYSGIFSPVESAAAGCLATLIFTIIEKKITKLEQIKECLRESAKTSAMVFIVIIAALFFSRFLAISRIPLELSEMILSWNANRYVILTGVLVLWFILGMLILPTGILAITLPVVYPILLKVGFDPVWLGVIALKLIEIAAVTPPVGLNVYALKGVIGKDQSIEEIFVGIWPFIICDIVILILLIVFPQICLFLPNLMLG